MTRGIGGHESTHMLKDEWLTPPWVIKALGHFDLDPCSPVGRPWDTADHHYTIIDDGLKQPWFGRVWCNPPYGKHVAAWIRKLAEHGDGIALIFARTETKAFFDHVWPRADALLFIEGRLAFHHVDGRQAENSGGAPSVLIAYGERNVDALINSNIKGAVVRVEKRSPQPQQVELLKEVVS